MPKVHLLKLVWSRLFWLFCELYCASMNHAILGLTPCKDYEQHAAEKRSMHSTLNLLFLHKRINWDTTTLNLCSMCSLGRGQRNWNDRTWNGAHLGKMKVSLLHLRSWQAIHCSLAKPWGSNACLTIASQPCICISVCEGGCKKSTCTAVAILLTLLC